VSPIPTLSLFRRDVQKCVLFQVFILFVDTQSRQRSSCGGRAVESGGPVGKGYAGSKWIAWRIPDAAAERTPFWPVLVRLDQVFGEGTVRIEKEWSTSLERSGLTLLSAKPRWGKGNTDYTDGIVASRTFRLTLGLRRQMQCSRYRTSIPHPTHTPPTSSNTSLQSMNREILDVSVEKSYLRI